MEYHLPTFYYIQIKPLCYVRENRVESVCFAQRQGINNISAFFPLITAKWTLNLILPALFHIQ